MAARKRARVSDSSHEAAASFVASDGDATARRTLELPAAETARKGETLFKMLLPVFYVFSAAGIILCVGATFVGPAIWFPCMLVIGFFFGLVIASLIAKRCRTGTEMVTVLGRGWLASTAWGTTCFVFGNHRFNLCSAVPTSAVAILAALTFFVPIFMQLVHVHETHRLMNHSMIAAAYYLSPHWCQMAHSWCSLLMWYCLLVGETVGSWLIVSLRLLRADEMNSDDNDAPVLELIPLRFALDRHEALYVHDPVNAVSKVGYLDYASLALSLIGGVLAIGDPAQQIAKGFSALRSVAVIHYSCRDHGRSSAGAEVDGSNSWKEYEASMVARRRRNEVQFWSGTWFAVCTISVTVHFTALGTEANTGLAGDGHDQRTFTQGISPFVIMNCVLLFLETLQLWKRCIPSHHFLLCRSSSLLAVTLIAPYSSPIKATVFAACVMFMGDLFGYTFDYFRRNIYMGALQQRRTSERAMQYRFEADEREAKLVLERNAEEAEKLAAKEVALSQREELFKLQQRQGVVLEHMQDVFIELSFSSASKEGSSTADGRADSGSAPPSLLESSSLLLDASIVHTHVTTFVKLFGAKPSSKPGFWPSLFTESADLLALFKRAIACANDSNHGDAAGDSRDSGVEEDGNSTDANDKKEHSLNVPALLKFLRPENGAECMVRISAVYLEPNMLIVCHDVTEMLRGVQLEVARSKDLETMRYLSHEYKNRFVAVRDLVNGMEMGTALEQSQALSEIGKSVDDGLFMCIQHSVALELEHDSYVLHNIVFEVEKTLCSAFGRRCRVSIDKQVPIVARLDGDLMLYALDNLINNAEKYGPTERWRVDLHVGVGVGSGEDQASNHRCRHASYEGLALVVTVINSPGDKHEEACALYGHDEDAIPTILEKGGRCDMMKSSGRGLRIAKRCAELLKGRVELRFTTDAVFATLTLPIAAAGPRMMNTMNSSEHEVENFDTSIIQDSESHSMSGSAESAAVVPTLNGGIDNNSALDNNAASARRAHNGLCAASLEGVHIVSIDDDEFIRKFDKMLFKKVKAIATVRGATEEEIIEFPEYVASMSPQPSIVILDQHLDHPIIGGPFVKGTDLVPQLRRLGYSGKIVFKSANHTSEDRKAYILAGADGVIPKGISKDAMVIELTIILDSTPDMLSLSEPILDRSVLQSLDRDEASMHMRGFFHRGPDMAKKAGTLCSGRDYERAWTCIHKLKSLAEFVGARRLTAACARTVLMLSNEQKDDWAKIQETMDAIKVHTDEVSAALSSFAT